MPSHLLFLQMFDAIIVGASFAGLAVANQLRDRRVLIVDRKPVGSGQTSACGTILPVLQHWDLQDAVLQTHDGLCLHIAGQILEFPSPYLWCTFDYHHLCETLLARSGAEYLQATAFGVERDSVVTSEGTFRARCLVDASGWQACLVSGLRPGVDHPRALNFGLETILPLPDGVPLKRSSLHFWFEPVDFAGGIGWAFPRGGQIGVGVASYRGALPMGGVLDDFSRQLFLQPDGLHGTYFPNTLLEPNVGNVFVVGDAAGMCIGLTGEGIRPALFFGEACGISVHRVLEGDLTLTEGLAEYSVFVRSRRPFFQFFSWVQVFLPRLPLTWIRGVAHGIQRKQVRAWVFDRYWELTGEWGPTSGHRHNVRAFES